MSNYYNYNSIQKQARLGLKIKTAAKQNRVDYFIMINNKYYLKINIKAIPEKGEANEAIINFLTDEWKITRNNLEIILGHKNNLKILNIKNIEPGYLNLILQHYIKL